MIPLNTFELAKEHFLNGLDFFNSGSYENAEIQFNKSLELTPNRVSTLINLSLVQYYLKKYSAAKSTAELAISIDNNNCEPYLNLGLIEKDLNNLELALYFFSKSLLINPFFYEASFNIGCTLLELEKYVEAVCYFNKTINIKKNHHGSYLFRGIAFNQLKQYQDALVSYNFAIDLRPDCYETWFKKGYTYSCLFQHSDALYCYNKSIKINPYFPESWTNRGLALNALLRYDEALLSFDSSVSLKTDFPETWNNRGITLYNLGRYKDAIDSYDKSIAIKPNYYEALWNKSLVQLSVCDFSDAWINYESRWNVSSNNLDIINLDVPLFNLASKNKKVLIWREQGLGDEILFSTMYGDVHRVFKELTIQVDPRMLNIFRRSFPDLIFISSSAPLSNDEYSHQLPSGSLGQYLRTSTYDFISNSNASNRLKAYYPIVNNFKSRLDLVCNNKICGFTWKSSNTLIGDLKSLKLSDLLPIFKIPNITFVSLQYGDVADEITEFNSIYGTNLINFSDIDHFNDLESHIGVIETCDFLILSSNTTAHFAGALGKNSYVITPYGQGLLWYWNNNNSNGKNLWYPSIEVFRQPSPYAWNDPIISIYEQIIKQIR